MSEVKMNTWNNCFIVDDGIVLVNMTPHNLDIIQTDGNTLTVAPSGIVPRCSSSEEIDGTIGDLIQITRQTLGEVEGLPDPVPGAFYIVSRLVASAANRPDLLVPGPLVRDDQGRVIGCNGLSRL
nr:hypothetical protein [Catenibacterium mitsuokai]